MVGAQQIPQLEARTKALLRIDGQIFKDLNGNGELDAYEDWRLPVEERVDDLLSKMSLKEKVGMMLVDSLNADVGGTMSATAVDYVKTQKMTRFIFRNPVVPKPAPPRGFSWSGPQVSPYEAAQYMNAMQELAEGTRLGIPLLFMSNARNHLDPDARSGINVSAGAFSEWPKEGGLAATRDLDLIAAFAKVVAAEWSAIGLRGMYGYMADLATEPRWYRVHETFTEDGDLAAEIMTVLVENLQGQEMGPKSIMLTMKHFPGGGPQEGGGDPHYDYGKRQIYPSGNFDYHYKPFAAAIKAGLAAMMPYYGIPVGQGYGITLEGETTSRDVGMAFSKGILTDLLRGELGFKGVINSDTGIIGDCKTPVNVGGVLIAGCRAWGLEDKSIDEQITIAVNAGTDVLSGFHDNAQLLSLVESGQLSEIRVDESVRRLLSVQFELGLFENPYVDPNRASYVLGNAAHQGKADEAQRKSVVLLQNSGALPLPKATEDKHLCIYVMGIDADVVAASGGYRVISGDYDASAGQNLPDIPAETDYAIVRVRINNSPADPELIFGGANADELDLLAFSDMAKAQSWRIEPALEDIQAVMAGVGSENTIIAIYFRQPYVLDEASGLADAGALVATFGVRDDNLMAVLTGDVVPQGKLPFALANSAEAILRQASDAPGYDAGDTLFPFGHGLTY